MKKIIFLLIGILPLISAAQQRSNLADTIKTKDLSNPDRTYQTIYNVKGFIQSQGPMLNNKKDGVWREYSNGYGQLTKVIEYKNGVVNGVNIAFGSNGMMASDEYIINGKPEGTRTLMNNMGRVRSIENFKNGDLHGSKKTFYDDGKVQEEGFWKNGQRDGVTKWYTATGTMSLEHTYANGSLQGPVREYDSKGRVTRMGQYLENEENGEWQEFADSVLVKKVIYDKGKIMKEIPVKK